MTVAISTLIPEVRAELPGVPEPILTAALYRVIREFFWESEAWKYTYDNGLDWTADQLAVESPSAGTDIPTKTVVKRVDEIKYDAGGDAWDTPVPFKTRDELDRENPDWFTETGSNPVAWTHGNGGIAWITPQTTSTVTTALLIRAVIAPVFTALTDTLPDFLYYENEMTLKEGILAQIKKIPGKDWSDAVAARVHKSAFKNGIDKAKSRSEADYGQPVKEVAYGGI